MRISDVLRGKGSDVVTITGSASVAELVALLKQKGIGAVVVVGDDDSGAIAGIVSGSTTRKKIWPRDAPSTRAASMISPGISDMKLCSR